MCGIFGYLNYGTPRSRRFLCDTLVTGLRRLEYRGYDSAGLSVDDEGGKPAIHKVKGNVDALAALVNGIQNPDHQFDNHVGIAHTRWATHGEAATHNSHPHSSDPKNQFVVIHNGIISNYAAIKAFLISKGYQEWTSETDTEVIVKLALYVWDTDVKVHKDFLRLALKIVHHLEGAYALILKSSHFPGEACAVRRSSPLVLGIKADSLQNDIIRMFNTSRNLALSSDTVTNSLAEGAFKLDPESSAEYFLASDVHAIIEHTKKVIYLEDEDIVHFTSTGSFALIRNAKTGAASSSIQTLEMELNSISKGGYQHFMLKEINEQPETVINTMRGRINFETREVKLGGLEDHIASIRRCRRLIFIACGTSFHSALAVRQLLEELSTLPVSVELASDFLDRETPIFRDDSCFFISQSGETADTLQALLYCKEKGALLVGITNTVGSTVARETHCGVYLNAGAEIGVASTKAYTSQIVALTLLALQLGSDRRSSEDRVKKIIEGLRLLPVLIREALALDKQIKEVANTFVEKCKTNKSLILLGRGYQAPTILEAALKIKEIAYIHAEGINSGELKHGPLALIEENLPILMVATKDRVSVHVHNAIQQVTARKGDPVILCTKGDSSFDNSKHTLIRVPASVDCLQCIVNIIPLQLLSYHIAVVSGYNVDQPRNLAKSVTVQ